MVEDNVLGSVDDSLNVEVIVKFRDSEVRTLRRFSSGIAAHKEFNNIFIKECANASMLGARQVLKKEKMENNNG